MELPSEVKIGNLTFSIQEVEKINDEDLWGYIKYQEQQIKIKKALLLENKQEVLLHEIVHGVYQDRGLNPQDQEERVVDQISNGILKVLKENKDVRSFILG